MSAQGRETPGRVEPSGTLDRSVRAVERAIDVLFSFSQQEPVLDIPLLQERTGLSRPTLYRLLGTLERKGLVYSFGNPRRFQLGARFGLLASTWTPAPSLVALASGPLERLWASTQETVALVMPVSATHRMCVFERKSPQALSFSRGTGYTEPLHKGASGKVILAHLPPEQRLQSLGLASRREREQLARDIDLVRQEGVLVTHAEVMAGTVAVAAPVLARSGQPVAAVCVFGTELRLRGAAMRACRRDAIRAAREISSLL